MKRVPFKPWLMRLGPRGIKRNGSTDDWVVRLNPDVLIMDDNWLLETMGNSSVDAIFVDCNGKINTDFFVVRPQVIQTNLADTCTSGSGDTNAETHLTCVVSNIISSGRYVWATRKISEASLLHVSVEVYEVCRTVNSPILTRCDTFRLCQLQAVVKSLNVKVKACMPRACNSLQRWLHKELDLVSRV